MSSASRSVPTARAAASDARCCATGCDGSRCTARRVRLVNTQEDNTRALDLYLRAGFTQLPVGLCVLGRDL